jgi:steroid 5-alpha reductase family enzyme
MNILIFSLLVSVGLNVLMFIPAFIFKTDKLTDISYALTFVLISFYGLLNNALTATSLILFLMIFFWAFRLGTYLLIRIRKIGRDKRFDEMREKFFSFLRFWLLQGISVWIILLPSILFLNNPYPEFDFLFVLGLIIWLKGLIIESLADYQKYRFINNSENRGKWISSGVWKYSRHPNYFGEILVWLGIFVFAISGLNFCDVLIGVISPVYISLLLVFVSGIPELEKRANEKWGSNPGYQEYKRKTPVLIPKLFK